MLLVPALLACTFGESLGKQLNTQLKTHVRGGGGTFLAHCGCAGMTDSCANTWDDAIPHREKITMLTE